MRRHVFVKRERGMKKIIDIGIMMSIKDNAVLIALYMVVSIQGRNLLKGLKLNKMVKANSVQDALVHGLVFVGLLYLVGMLSRKVTGYNKKPDQEKMKGVKHIPHYRRATYEKDCGCN